MAADKLYILTKADGVQYIVRAESLPDDDPQETKDILVMVEEVTTHQRLTVPPAQLKRLDGLLDHSQ